MENHSHNLSEIAVELQSCQSCFTEFEYSSTQAQGFTVAGSRSVIMVQSSHAIRVSRDLFPISQILYAEQVLSIAGQRTQFPKLQHHLGKYQQGKEAWPIKVKQYPTVSVAPHFVD